MSDVENAVNLFREGCACSQALLATYGPRYGLDKERALRVAAGFAAGMRLAETCGAVTGSFMVFGLAFCDDSNSRTMEGRKPAYGAVVSFAEQFKRRHGSLLCEDLLGCDVSTPEGATAAAEKGLFRTKCVEIVRDAAGLVESMLPAK